MRTELLTVWRRLHIELDSMGIVSGNNVTGTFSGNQTIAASAETTLSLNVSPALETNRFENGRLVIKGVGSFKVVDHTTRPFINTTVKFANTSDTVTISNTTETPFEVSNGQSFTLYDDDDMNDGDGDNLDGDAGNENVGTPDTGILQSVDTPCSNVYNANNCNVFAPAYVIPKYDLTGSLEDVPFQLNIDQLASTTIYNNPNYFDNRGTETSVDFWTAYLLGAYQAKIDEDSDPDEWGAVYGRAENADGTAQGVAVFMELNRAREYQDLNRVSIYGTWNTRPVANRFITAHEIAHMFTGGHFDCVSGSPNQIPCPNDNAGLMSSPDQITQVTFSDVTLNKIRGGTGITNP